MGGIALTPLCRKLYTVAMRSADAHKVGLHVLYSNRSAALLRSAQTQRAIEDAREACALAPASPKVWGRLGTALFYAHEYLPACAAYRCAGSASWPRIWP